MNKIYKYLCAVVAILSSVCGLLYQCNSHVITNWIPAVVAQIFLIISFVIYAASVAGIQNVPKIFSKSFRTTQPKLLLIGIGIVLHILFINTYPLWLSEAFVLIDAHSIIHGNIPNPFSNTGDFPVKFMSYLVAPLYSLVPDVRSAVRLVGLLYIICFGIVLQSTLRLLSPYVSVVSLVFPFFSIWLINLSNTADNNWLSAVPLISILPFYLFLSSLHHTKHKVAIIPLLALSISLSFWTLYIPAVAGAAVIVLILFETKYRIREKMTLLFMILVLCLPILGRIFTEPSMAVGRHLDFLSQRGEGNLNSSLVGGYYKTIIRLIDAFIPDLGQAILPNRILFLEPTSLALFVLGLSLICVSKQPFKRNQLRLFLYLTLCTIGFIISNPVSSFWRTTVMAPGVYLFILIGFEHLHINSKQAISAITRAVILLGHLIFFSYYYSHQIQQQYDSYNVSRERFATEAYLQCLKQLTGSAKIKIVDDFPTFIPSVLSRNYFQEQNDKHGRYVVHKEDDLTPFINYRLIKLDKPQINNLHIDTVCIVTSPSGNILGYLEKN